MLTATAAVVAAIAATGNWWSRITLDRRVEAVTKPLATIAIAQGQAQSALSALARYTNRNPKDAQAFLLWGQVAEQAGQLTQAILAYERFLQLAPDDTLAPDVRAHLKDLAQQQAKTKSG